MLAETVEVDVLDDDHLAVVDGEQRVVQHFLDVGAIAAGQEPQRLFHAQRRAYQPFPVGVLPELGEQLTDEILHRSYSRPLSSLVALRHRNFRLLWWGL